MSGVLPILEEMKNASCKTSEPKLVSEMQDYSVLTIGLIAVLFLAVLKKSFGEKRRKFPSPWAFPLLGHVPYVFSSTNPVETINTWAKKYGPVLELQFAWIRVIMLNDKKSVAECFSQREFCGRKESTPIFKLFANSHGAGLVLEDNPNAEELRGFFLKAFRNHGLQKNKMEEHIRGEIGELVKSWHAKQGSDFELSVAFCQLSVNCLWRVIGTKRFELEEAQEIYKKIKMMTEMDSLPSFASIFFPGVIDHVSSIVRNKLDAFKFMNRMIRGMCKEDREGHRIPGEPQDIIDQFLDKVNETGNESSVFHKSKSSIAPALRDILLASVEAITTTLEWFVLFGLNNPEIISKLREEIDAVVGSGRVPAMEDREKMPFAEACVLEILRKPGLVPFGIPHCTTEDVEFRGVLLKKGTLVVSNLYAIHNDPEVWDEPAKFMPERFLTSEGTLISNAWSKILPYGSGKRYCLGASFIGDELFLILTSLYQQFDIKTTEKNVSLQEGFGLTVRPRHDIRIFVTPRS